jgi:hypothetical protein
MSCIILRPDPQVLFDQIRSAFSSTVLGGGTIIPESNEWYVVSNDYAMSEMFFAVADQMWRERNPETACCDNLFKMAARNGVFPRPASHAEGYAKLTGVVGSAIPPALEISAGASTYTSVGTIPLTIPSLAPGDTQGVAIVRVRALTPGPDANAHSDVPTGTLVTVAPGIDPDVIICGSTFCGGAAAEACEDFRKRYLDRLAYHPKATMAWLQQKILEFPCVTRVCVREGACCRCEAECGDCGCKNCGNRMELYALFENAFPCGIPPANVVEDLNTWVFGEHQGYGEGQVEIGVCGQIYAPWPLLVNVLIDIAGCPTVSQKQLIEDQVRASVPAHLPVDPPPEQADRIDRRFGDRRRDQRRGPVRGRRPSGRRELGLRRQRRRIPEPLRAGADLRYAAVPRRRDLHQPGPAATELRMMMYCS